jgi:hypothetical protein
VESNGIPIPKNEKQAKLMTAFADELREHSYLSMGECMSLASYLAERVVKEGWQWHPPKLEDFDLEHNKVVLTPHQEIDMMDRIISGLPIDVNQFGNGVKVYDVASLHPQEVKELWVRIPEFENYEMNLVDKDIRNRFTKRILETTNESGNIYTEMHDKEGFPHYISVEHVYEQITKNT